MDVTEFFLKLLAILLSAKLFAELFALLRLPSVLGEVIAGIVVGPSVIGFVTPDGTLYLLAEIGILLLLFEVGLDTDVGQLVRVGVQSMLVAATGVIAPAVVSYWVCTSLLDLPFVASLFISGTLVATSIGITVRVLVDLKKHQTTRAKIVLGAAVIDDIVGVVILAVLYDFAVTGAVSPAKTARVVGFIAVFLAVAPVLTKLFVPLIAKLSANSRTKGMVPTLIVSLILVLAVLSHEAGAPEILGSFAAGIALARRFFLPLGATIEHYSHGLAEKVEEHMKPVIDLFVPVFFFVVGASMNLKAIDFRSHDFWLMAGVLTVAAVLTMMVSGVWVKGGRERSFRLGSPWCHVAR
jgi:Kef-type K+ transport system membrane component KefB